MKGFSNMKIETSSLKKHISFFWDSLCYKHGYTIAYLMCCWLYSLMLTHLQDIAKFPSSIGKLASSFERFTDSKSDVKDDYTSDISALQSGIRVWLLPTSSLLMQLPVLLFGWAASQLACEAQQQQQLQCSRSEKEPGHGKCILTSSWLAGCSVWTVGLCAKATYGQ